MEILSKGKAGNYEELFKKKQPTAGIYNNEAWEMLMNYVTMYSPWDSTTY